MFRLGFVGLAILFLVASPIGAQNRISDGNALLNPNSPQSCEESILSMEVLAKLTLEQTKDDGVLVAVARLGSGERSSEWNRRRLYNVREFLKDRAGIPKEKIIISEGERVFGLGRVEFYLGGKLIGKLPLARNKDLCLVCCTESGPYYPHKDNSKNKRKER